MYGCVEVCMCGGVHARRCAYEVCMSDVILSLLFSIYWLLLQLGFGHR